MEMRENIKFAYYHTECIFACTYMNVEIHYLYVLKYLSDVVLAQMLDTELDITLHFRGDIIIFTY